MLNSKLLLYIARNSLTIIFLILLMLSITTKEEYIIFLFLLIILSDISNWFFKNLRREL